MYAGADDQLKRPAGVTPCALCPRYNPGQVMHMEHKVMAVTTRAGLAVLLLAATMLASAAALAQSVRPNRYGTGPATTGSDARSTYQRQRALADDAESNRAEAVRRAERDRIAVAIDSNRQRMQADRARTDRRRAHASPAEAERLRLDFEQRRLAYERQREDLERQRAEAESTRANPQPPPPPPPRR